MSWRGIDDMFHEPDERLPVKDQRLAQLKADYEPSGPVKTPRSEAAERLRAKTAGRDAEIKELHEYNGMTVTVLARLFRLSHQRVSQILHPPES